MRLCHAHAFTHLDVLEMSPINLLCAHLSTVLMSNVKIVNENCGEHLTLFHLNLFYIFPNFVYQCCYFTCNNFNKALSGL